jgi:hypothetical protein
MYSQPVTNECCFGQQHGHLGTVLATIIIINHMKNISKMFQTNFVVMKNLATTFSKVQLKISEKILIVKA